MPADTLLTAADLRRALAREPEPLADLAQLVALAAPGDRATFPGRRGLAGQEAIELVRRAMDAAGAMR